MDPWIHGSAAGAAARAAAGAAAGAAASAAALCIYYVSMGEGASRPLIYKGIGLRVLANTWILGGFSRLSQSLPRQVFQERPPKAFPRLPKASPRPPKAAPKPPQASPKAPQGVPKGSPKTFPKDSKDFLKILEKPKKNNVFQCFSNPCGPQVGLMLAYVG